jgi:hypothetical protein
MYIYITPACVNELLREPTQEAQQKRTVSHVEKAQTRHLQDYEQAYDYMIWTTARHCGQVFEGEEDVVQGARDDAENEDKPRAKSADEARKEE